MRIIRLTAEMPGGWLGHVPLFCPKLVTEGNSQFLDGSHSVADGSPALSWVLTWL